MLDRQQLIQYKHENERLRELLNLLKDFGYEDRFEMIPATVTAMPGDRVVESLTIDKGSDHELRIDMAVVVPEGLVGKLSWVLPRKAVIDPLTGPISGVGVVVERNRVRGVVWARYGLSTEPVTWTMDYVDLHEDVVPGDRVITSGLGGVYPPGLLVGTVRSVSQDPVEKRVLIDRAVDVSEIEQVFVLAPKYLLSGSHEETEASIQRKLALSAELERTLTNGASE
jgi:rod shape-determining protein MreC